MSSDWPWVAGRMPPTTCCPPPTLPARKEKALRWRRSRHEPSTGDAGVDRRFPESLKNRSILHLCGSSNAKANHINKTSAYQSKLHENDSSAHTARVVVDVHLGRDEGAAALHMRYGDVQVGVGKEVMGGSGGGGGRPVGGGGVGRAGVGRSDGGLEFK